MHKCVTTIIRGGSKGAAGVAPHVRAVQRGITQLVSNYTIHSIMYYVIRNSCPPPPNTDLATPNCCSSRNAPDYNAVEHHFSHLRALVFVFFKVFSSILHLYSHLSSLQFWPTPDLTSYHWVQSLYLDLFCACFFLSPYTCIAITLLLYYHNIMCNKLGLVRMDWTASSVGVFQLMVTSSTCKSIAYSVTDVALFLKQIIIVSTIYYESAVVIETNAEKSHRSIFFGCEKFRNCPELLLITRPAL